LRAFAIPLCDRHSGFFNYLRRDSENPLKSQAVIARQQLILLRRVTPRGKYAHLIFYGDLIYLTKVLLLSGGPKLHDAINMNKRYKAKRNC